MNKYIAKAASAMAFFVLFNPASAKAAALEQTFTVSYQCNTNVNLRAQTGVTQQQLIQSCDEITETEAAFHNFFNTNSNTPLPNDNNDTLDVFIYLSSAEYKANGGEHFGISTDNGGMYLEGTPSNVGNQAKFIAHICEDSWVPFSCAYQGQVYNLQHEYVHYLDGRFNVAGPFGTFSYNAGLAEGLADFLAYGQDYTRTINGVANLDIPPLYNILSANYSHPDLYKWGYLAMHYMSNSHRSDYDQIVTALRSGDPATYQSTIKSVAQRIGSGFDNYVTTLTNAVAINQGTLPNDNSFGACNLEHKYVRYVDDLSNANISVTNLTDTPMRLMWINNVSGDAGTEEIALLTQGQEYNNDFWRENDRFMMISENRECVGVGVIGQTSVFSIDNELVANITPDILPEPNEVGSCSLERPYFKGDGTANAIITNNTNESVEVRWVNHVTGTRSDTVYANLSVGESFNASSWSEGDRMIFVDSSNQCKGVAVLNAGSNTFSIDSEQPTNLNPTANANGAYNAIENTAVNFNSSGSLDSDGSITSFYWEFGDGNSSTLANPTHTYLTAGVYTVTLKVTDNEGAIDTDTTSATITKSGIVGGNVPDMCGTATAVTSGQLVAGEAACLGSSSAIWLSLSDVNSHNSVTIKIAHGSGDLSVDYSNSGWPNGSNSNGSSNNSGNAECIHVTGNTNYWGYLKVSNSSGEASILVEFDRAGCDNGGGNSNTAPVAIANGPYSGEVNQAISFNSNGSTDAEGPIASYEWNFGDGSNSTDANPSHTYATAGVYDVTLTVTDGSGVKNTVQTAATVVLPQTGSVEDVCTSQSPLSGWVDANNDICVPSGNWSNSIAYYGVNVPPGTTSIVITTAHGTGNGNLYYQASGWANETSYDQKSENSGNNESITITSPISGNHYFSIVGAKSGMAVRIEFR